jgi:H+/Cl- antiporter ClcA
MIFILKAGALAAFLATAASALLIATLIGVGPMQGTTPPTVLDILRAAFWLTPITAVSCGSFGFLAGIAGSALLDWRRRRIRSTRRLVIESGIVGFVLGFSFLFFDAVVNPRSHGAMQALLSAPVGMGCAVLCALAFRGRFVKE